MALTYHNTYVQYSTVHSLESIHYTGTCRPTEGHVRLGSAKMSDKEGCISFSVNGKLYKLHNVNPSATLNQWLRCQPHLKGTKQMCNEGGCGACVVAITQMDLTSNCKRTISVNSVGNKRKLEFLYAFFEFVTCTWFSASFLLSLLITVM